MKFEQLKIWYRVRARGFWSVCIFAALSLTGLLALPAAKGNPIVGPSYDFATGPQGWTPQAVGKNGQLPPNTNGQRWTHGSGQWSVNWAPVSSPFVATGNYLTSPSIDFSGPNGDAGIDALRISLAHKFNFSSSLNGEWPIVHDSSVCGEYRPDGSCN